MKNKFSLLIVSIFCCLLSYSKIVQSNEIKFESQVIDVIDQNLVEASGGVKITNDLGQRINADNLKDKINNGGLPAFIEPFGDNQELFAIYVGPFQTEDDIVNNMKLIQELSESKKGEISRWKL